MLILLKLLSGVALLIWATNLVRVGILRMFGGNFRRLLAGSVNNRFRAFLAGVGVTSLVQSSNATALMTSAFVGQGMIGLAPALAIMLGANVGTALMVTVFSFDLSWLSPLLIFLGVLLHLSRKGARLGHAGRVLVGLGLITLSLELITEASRPIVAAAGVKVLFASLSGDLLLDTLLGALLAMLTYSSLAVVLFCAALTEAGIVSTKVALCLVLGANLGSGLAALFSVSPGNQAAKRVVLGNLLSRMAGCVLALPFLLQIQSLLTWFSTDPARLIVNFHLLFNGMLALLLIGGIGQMARLCQAVLPGEGNDNTVAPRHLDRSALQTPVLALTNAAREVLRIGDRIEHMLDGLIRVIRNDDDTLLRTLQSVDDEVDTLYSAIKLYLTRIPHDALNPQDSRRWNEIMMLTLNLERAGDMIDHMLQDVQQRKIRQKFSFSEAGLAELTDLHTRLVSNLRQALAVFLSSDRSSAERLMHEKERFRTLERQYAANHLQRIAGHSQESLETSSLHLDLISDMKQLNSLFCAAAYPVLEQAGALLDSRLKQQASPSDRQKEGNEQYAPTSSAMPISQSVPPSGPQSASPSGHPNPIAGNEPDTHPRENQASGWE